MPPDQRELSKPSGCRLERPSVGARGVQPGAHRLASGSPQSECRLSAERSYNPCHRSRKIDCGTHPGDAHRRSEESSVVTGRQERSDERDAVVNVTRSDVDAGDQSDG